MRTFSCLSLALVGLWLGADPVWADPADDILDRAVKAHGGADKIGKLRKIMYTARGTLNSPGGLVPATREASLEFPEKVRYRHRFSSDMLKSDSTVIFTGSTGWLMGNGMVVELNVLQSSDLRDETYARWLSTLIPLAEKGQGLRKDGTTLTVLPEIPVGERTAVGVKVARRGQPIAVELYFDKRTGLLVKTGFEGKEAGLKMYKEWLYDAYRSVEGVEVPTKITERMNGKRVTFEWTEVSYKFVESHPADTFKKPTGLE